MARVYGIKKRLAENNFDEKFIKEIIGNGDLTGIISRMEESLDFDVMYQILDSCACLGSRDYLKQCEKIGKEIADKTLKEKVNHLNKNSETLGCYTDYYKIVLNDDNTLTVTMSFKNDGKYNCVCYAAVRNGVKVSDLALIKDDSDGRVMPLSYCYCCAGSSRVHLQLKLGVELKTKEIVSSPINSRGEKPCEFVFEIV